MLKWHLVVLVFVQTLWKETASQYECEIAYLTTFLGLKECIEMALQKPRATRAFDGGLNSQFTAILTFELAKKRGEKVDDAKAQNPATPKSTVEGEKK
jgi:hypothetical protein